VRWSTYAGWRALLAVLAASLLLSLLGAERAEAVPSVTYKCSPAPQNCVGWYRSNVSIDWTITPSDATVVAGCQDKSFTTDTPGTNEFCKVDDGEATVTVELKMRVDKTAPTLLGGNPGRGADSNGWYNHPVSVAFSGTDQTSGIDACSTVTYSGPDRDPASLTGSCIDKAGNVATLGYGLKYDSTAPVATGGQPRRQADRNGWHNRAVVVDFAGTDGLSGVLGCTSTSYSGPDGAVRVPGTCTDRAGNVSSSVSVPLSYDDTAPVVTGGAAARGPDVSGWYNHPVSVAFSGSDATSGVESCTAATYSAPDSASASQPGTCTDRAGNRSNQLGFGLKYDATPPQVTSATAERGPDVNGWYNGPVEFAIAGDDATAGILACPDVTYAGPDGAAASLTGRCTDRAGNQGSRAFGLKFDSTAPALMDLAATPADRSVALSWRTTPDADSVGVTRTPGVGQESSSVVFRGPGTGFVDGRVDNGVQYAYEVRVQDPAGNARSETVSAVPFAQLVPLAVGGGVAAAETVTTTPGGASAPTARVRTAHLIAPAAGAVIRAGRRPLLRWTPVPGASYYNVQLFRGGKILTAWTRQPQHRLELRWRHGGRRYRLTPGEYHWIVWPGFGLRSKADYGRRIGRRAFEVAPAGR